MLLHREREWVLSVRTGGGFARRMSVRGMREVRVGAENTIEG